MDSSPQEDLPQSRAPSPPAPASTSVPMLPAARWQPAGAGTGTARLPIMPSTGRPAPGRSPRQRRPTAASLPGKRTGWHLTSFRWGFRAANTMQSWQATNDSLYATRCLGRPTAAAQCTNGKSLWPPSLALYCAALYRLSHAGSSRVGAGPAAAGPHRPGLLHPRGLLVLCCPRLGWLANKQGQLGLHQPDAHMHGRSAKLAACF